MLLCFTYNLPCLCFCYLKQYFGKCEQLEVSSQNIWSPPEHHITHRFQQVALTNTLTALNTSGIWKHTSSHDFFWSCLIFFCLVEIFILFQEEWVVSHWEFNSKCQNHFSLLIWGHFFAEGLLSHVNNYIVRPYMSAPKPHSLFKLLTAETLKTSQPSLHLLFHNVKCNLKEENIEMPPCSSL